MIKIIWTQCPKCSSIQYTDKPDADKCENCRRYFFTQACKIKDNLSDEVKSIFGNLRK